MDNNAIDIASFPYEGTLPKQIKAVIAWGLRAPSTHNTQPWLFRINNNACEIFMDKTRTLREADPTGRDAYMSHGCLLQHINIAARYFGMSPRIDIVPDGNKVAVCTFERSTKDKQHKELEPLLCAINKRFNARGNLLTLPGNAKSEILNAQLPENVFVRFVDDEIELGILGNMVNRAITEVHRRSAFRAEFSNWMRNNRSQKRDGIHGYSVFAPLLVSYLLPYAIRLLNLGKKLGALNEETIINAPLAAIVSVSADTPHEWVKAGMAIEMLALTAVAHGAAASFFASPVEVTSIRNELRAMFVQNALPQFLVVFGVPERPTPTTPRMPLAERLMPEG